jgi:hypothetical protein
MTELQFFFQQHQLNYRSINELLQEAVELERLKLDVHRLTDGESIACHLKIIEGERLIALLTIADCC